MHAFGDLELLSEKGILEGALNSVVFHTAQINGSGKGTYHPVTDSGTDAWLICSWKPPTTESLIFPKQSSLMFTLSLWEGALPTINLLGTDKPRLITTAQRAFCCWFGLVLLFFGLPLLHICRLPEMSPHTGTWKCITEQEKNSHKSNTVHLFERCCLFPFASNCQGYADYR